MKVNNIIRAMILKKDLKTIYILAIISSLVLIFGWGVLGTPDSPTYISAGDNYINGKIDALRTPVYPFFLGLLKILFGEKSFCFIAICIQHIVFLLSVSIFHKIATSILQSANIVFWLTLFYSVFPCITTWNNYILTESFAFCGTIFLLYLTLRLFQKWSVWIWACFVILLVVLMFLRPALIYVLPVFSLVGFCLALNRKRRKSAVYCMLSVVIASICLFSYMKIFERQFGIFATSSVGTFNQLCIANEDNLLNIDIVEDEELKADITAHQLWGKYDLKTINYIIVSSYKSHPMKCVQKSLGRMYRSKSKSFFLTLAPGFSTVFDMIGFNLNTLYLFLLIYTTIIFYWIKKKGYIPWITALIYMLGVSNIIVAIVGAQAEWERLILPSMPLYLLMFGQLCTIFHVHSPLDTKFR